MLRALQQAGWMIDRPVHDCLSRIEFERHRAGVTGSTLAAPNADNGLVAGVSPSAADGLRTRRISTVGVDFAANGPISPDEALVDPTGPAQAATNGGQGTNGSGWPSRSTVTDQAR